MLIPSDEHFFQGLEIATSISNISGILVICVWMPIGMNDHRRTAVKPSKFGGFLFGVIHLLRC